MDAPRYTITRQWGTLPWRLTRATASGGVYLVGTYLTHADAVAAMGRQAGGVVSIPLALREGRAYGHTLVVTEDPAAARRRALKARRMAARRRARRSAPLSAWESTPARLESLAAVYASMARSARASTRADFTLAAPSNGGR